MPFPGASLLLALALSSRAAETPINELPVIGVEMTTDKFRVGKPFEMWRAEARCHMPPL